jgi:hypothetical protein
MSLESNVTQISDLNEAWPLSSDPRHYGADHLRNIKIALKSLLTNPGQLGQKLYADAEAPSGVTIGSTSIGLAHTPSPAESLILVRNGVVLKSGLDFTLATATITLTTAIVADEWFLAWYRY